MQDIQTDILMGFAARILLFVLLSRPYLLPCAGEKRKKEKKILTGVVMRGHSYLLRLERAILL
jgi:hypothetical protein